MGGGAYKYMCYTGAGSGAECAVRCVHMCSVGMGQENLNKDLQYIQLFISRGSRCASTNVGTEPVRPGYIPVDVVAGRQLFCISSAQCTEGRNVVFERSSQHGLLVF